MPTFKQVPRKLIWITLVTIIIVFGLIKVYDRYKYAFINEKIKTAVQQNSNSLYKITYDSISIDEIAGNLFINNLRISPDTTLQLQYLQAGDNRAATVLLDVAIPKLQVTGFKTPVALLSKKLICDQVTITSPHVKVYMFSKAQSDKDTTSAHEQFYKQLLGELNLIKAEKIEINNGEIIALDHRTGEQKFSTSNTSIRLELVAIDSSTMKNADKTFFSKRVQVTSDKLILGEGDNAAEANDIFFDTDSKKINIGRFTYELKAKGNTKSVTENISLAGFSWKGQPDNSEIYMEHVTIGKTELQVSQTGNSGSTSSENKRILNGWIKKFTLSKLELKQADITLLPTKERKQKIAIHNTALAIKNISLDTTVSFGADLGNHLKNLQVSNGQTTISNSDNIYQYRFSNLSIDAAKQSIAMSQVEIRPIKSEVEFAKKAGVQKDRFHVTFNNLKAATVDMAALLNGEIRIHEIGMTGNKIKIARDTRYPLDSVSKIGKYPHQLLMALPIAISIDKVDMLQTELEYKEINALTDQSGTVQFFQTDLSIIGVKNRNIKRDQSVVMKFSSRFMKKIPLEGSIDFILDDIGKGKFTVNGKVKEAFDVTIINPLIIPLSAARFDKGFIQELAFSFSGDNLTSSGNVHLIYDQLKISLLKKKEAGYKKKDLLSFLANAIIIDKSNKTKSAEKQNATATNQRDEYRSFFNHVWKTIFNGTQKIIS